jgi:hypothetical protein
VGGDRTIHAEEPARRSPTGRSPRHQWHLPRAEERLPLAGLSRRLRAAHDYLQPLQPLVAKAVWTGMLEALAKAGAATDNVAIDATYVKVQRSAFGAKGGPRRGRSAYRAAETQRKSMP